jgi:mRNA interferase RelE/StbE
VSRYRVEFKPSAAKALARLPGKDRKRIATVVDALREDPRPEGCRKLEGSDDLYRIRAGAYRVVYAVRDAVLLVLVVRIGDRREVYRRIDRLGKRPR